MGWFSDFLKGTGKAAGQAAVDSAKMTAVLAAQAEMDRMQRNGVKLSARNLRDITMLRDACNALLAANQVVA